MGTTICPTVPVARPAAEPWPVDAHTIRVDVMFARQLDQHGCHTCGKVTPGTKLGHWVPDHQPPSALSRPGEAQRLYPQCLGCRYQQGGEVTQPRKQEGGQK
jgi:hypothetical protein